jgi:hypothetical protein
MVNDPIRNIIAGGPADREVDSATILQVRFGPNSILQNMFIKWRLPLLYKRIYPVHITTDVRFLNII